MSFRSSTLFLSLSVLTVLMSQSSYAESRYHWSDLNDSNFFNNQRMYSDMADPRFWTGSLPPLPKNNNKCVLVTPKIQACNRKLYTLDGRRVSVIQGKVVIEQANGGGSNESRPVGGVGAKLD